MLLAVVFIHCIKNYWNIFLPIRLVRTQLFLPFSEIIVLLWVVEKKEDDYCKSDYLPLSTKYKKNCGKICVYKLMS